MRHAFCLQLKIEKVSGVNLREKTTGRCLFFRYQIDFESNESRFDSDPRLQPLLLGIWRFLRQTFSAGSSNSLVSGEFCLTRVNGLSTE